MSDEQAMIHTLPAKVIGRALSTDQLKTLTHADFGDVEPFFWTAEISNNNLDFYYGRMAESTLRNFAADAAAGVPFLDSHNHFSLGYGHSVTGVLEMSGESSRVVADFYTIPGIRFAQGQTYQSTDDFIRAVLARLVRDVSVGFCNGQRICDICGHDVWAIDWDEFRYLCPHIPGVEYPIGDRGESVVLATFNVEDANLSEVSGVFDGATPGAALTEKAQRMIEVGELLPGQVRQLEARYRIKLPGADRQTWPGVDTNGKGKLIMTEPKKPEQTVDDPMASIRAILAEAEVEIKDGGELDGVRYLISTITHLASEVERLLPFEDEIKRLQPLADDGKLYRADLITETLAEGVRAMGDTFPEETYRGMLENGTSLEAIKKMRDAFAEQAKQRLPGGRQTVDDDEKQTTQRTEPATPHLAYAAA